MLYAVQPSQLSDLPGSATLAGLAPCWQQRLCLSLRAALHLSHAAQLQLQAKAAAKAEGEAEASAKAKASAKVSQPDSGLRC